MPLHRLMRCRPVGGNPDRWAPVCARGSRALARENVVVEGRGLNTERPPIKPCLRVVEWAALAGGTDMECLLPTRIRRLGIRVRDSGQGVWLPAAAAALPERIPWR